ncbi:hypothetical protein COL5a_005879 [Colletotrichum fioriniae]|uniref:uncharacterized protein n=1 Tax=Colletotrichum fioriniae TaxID=710243 RepID=UPI00230048BB|nr:uncharacterized protein COL516b_006689 [Colletotrichum fioriniae]KAJ0303178.1 hypothetical protein COL516b_006689 [Colletotrichum fioriniae]KAJ0327500.1 hypothetical protein COL5a_005879 [Colletotrichum fioriniae]KAJ3938354.1 hypothetical protein N0V96_011599 [Colletotrichum fioriniae]
MLAKLLSLLAISTTLASAASYQLRTFAPSEPKVHDQLVNVEEERFWIGLERPTTWCPDFSGGSCPPGNTTVVDGVFGRMKSMMSPGQLVYLDPFGVISYTAGDALTWNTMPHGSNFNCFEAVEIWAPADATKKLRLVKFINLGDPAASARPFFYSCPIEGKKHSFVRVRWTSQHGHREWGVDWDSQCTAMEGLILVESKDEIGAYQYV